MVSGHVRTLRRSTKAIEIPTRSSREYFLSSIMTLSQPLVPPDDKLRSVSVPQSQNACGSDFLVFLSIKFSILKIIEPPMAEKSLKIRDAVIESAQNFVPS